MIRYCEELAFPQFFSQGRFGYSAEREIKLSPKCFSQRLLDYKQSFASISLHFFVKSVLQEKNFRDQMSISINKKVGDFTAGMFKKYKHPVEELVKKDQGFYFMNQIRGTPAYWKKF